MCARVCVYIYMRGHMSAHVCAWSCVRTCLWSMVIRWAPLYISHTDVFSFCCTCIVYMYKKPQLVDRLYCIHNDLSVGVRAHSTRQNPHPVCLSVSAFSHSLTRSHTHTTTITIHLYSFLVCLVTKSLRGCVGECVRTGQGGARKAMGKGVGGSEVATLSWQRTPIDALREEIADVSKEDPHLFTSFFPQLHPLAYICLYSGTTCNEI